MKKSAVITLLLGIVILFISCNGNNQQTPSKTDETKMTTKEQPMENNLTDQRLRRFDSLDFDFYSNQKWDSLAISHDPNIKVYYPDGTTSTGLFPQHIDLIKGQFVFAPDTKITSHPIKFGSGDYTCVIGEMEGTFSKPMPLGNGKTIAPTGKKFKIRMCTVGHWNGEKMTEEYLFWDNQSFMKQIGLAQ
jgi:SnoaL-like polyketide cyclase